MHPPSLVATSFGDRWRAAASDLRGPAFVLAVGWMLYAIPLTINDGARGLVLVLQCSMPPLITVALLTASVAAVRAGRFRGRARTLALVAAATMAAVLAVAFGATLLMVSGLWSPAWPWYVVWWFNFGPTAMICVGAALIEDYRVQGLARSATLREARHRAADVVRRTAEVRLQAARARVEPRFLFDALSAVERVYDADAVAGSRLLDDLVAYLRAVMPDLREQPAAAGRDAEIARLELAIEKASAGETA